MDNNKNISVTWSSFFCQFKNEPAIFFNHDKIFVEEKTNTPFMCLSTIVETNNIRIDNYHRLDTIIIIACSFLKPTDQYIANLLLVPIKSYLSTVSLTTQTLILKGYHWLQWDTQSKFCGQCGQDLHPMIETPEKRCTQCDCSFFPRFSPAIVVVVRKEDKILLARSPHFLPGVYSALAGFIDIGETAEAAVVREVKEEVGIEVHHINYVGSQTWPFPDSFMIAFKAEYLSGDIVLDENELEDAAWFGAHDLPKLPARASISRQLIDTVLAETTCL